MDTFLEKNEELGPEMTLSVFLYIVSLHKNSVETNNDIVLKLVEGVKIFARFFILQLFQHS